MRVQGDFCRDSIGPVGIFICCRALRRTYRTFVDFCLYWAVSGAYMIDGAALG